MASQVGAKHSTNYQHTLLLAPILAMPDKSHEPNQTAQRSGSSPGAGGSQCSLQGNPFTRTQHNRTRVILVESQDGPPSTGRHHATTLSILPPAVYRLLRNAADSLIPHVARHSGQGDFWYTHAPPASPYKPSLPVPVQTHPFRHRRRRRLQLAQSTDEPVCPPREDVPKAP